MPSGHVMICQSLLTFFMLEAVRHHLLSAVIVSLLLMPAMPWARWYNGDHSAKQVALTFIMATVIGLIDYVAFLLFFVDGWASETEKVLLAEVASLPSPSGGPWQPVAVLDCRPSSLSQHLWIVEVALCREQHRSRLTHRETNQRHAQTCTQSSEALDAVSPTVQGGHSLENGAARARLLVTLILHQQDQSGSEHFRGSSTTATATGKHFQFRNDSLHPRTYCRLRCCRAAKALTRH
ncbi:unnamed protein product [Symbiodinium sp. CCMP2456]|nr:unnamed protein product [Symbiodinium sp. CCMP2456]